MKKSAKRKIIYILIIIVIVFIYVFFINKNQNYIENEFLINEISNENLDIDNDINQKNILNKSENKIVVYITGAIKNVGVYEIEERSRIADLIELAGGLTEDASIENLNLAYILEDGLKVHIPSKNEKSNEVHDDTQNYVIKDNNSNQNMANSTNKENSVKVNINTANQSELETLPGIGPSTALKIIQYREENGKFKNIEDIKKVNGIGESKYSKIRDYIKI